MSEPTSPVDPSKREEDLQNLAASVDQLEQATEQHLNATPTPRKPTDASLDPDNFLHGLDSDFEDGQDEAAQAVPESFIRADRLSNPNVRVTEPMYKKLPDGASPEDVIPLPSLDTEELLDLQSGLQGVKFNTAGAAEWANAMKDAVDLMHRDRLFSRSLTREKSQWLQFVEHEGRKVSVGVPSTPSIRPGQEISGDQARLFNQRIMGNYGSIQIPLWNSGVWLNVRTAGTDELHLLEQQLAAAQYDLGYMSHGLAYSNTSMHSMMLIVGFILDRVIGSNLEDTSIKNLEKSILVVDLFPLIAMYAATVYPSGFPYGRPCSRGPIHCTHIEQEILRLTKIVLHDNAALKPEHLRHMAGQTLNTRKYTADDLARYRDAFTHYGDRRVWLKKDKIAAVLSPPTVEQYRQSGDQWIAQILREANTILTDASTQEINSFMNNQYTLTTMRQYGHWVKAIEYPIETESSEERGEAVVRDRASIEQNLADQSSDTEIANAFMDEIRKYMEDCTVSVVGVTRGKCSKCGTDLVGEGGHPHIIPIDPVQVFFILRGRKIQSTLYAYMAH